MSRALDIIFDPFFIALSGIGIGAFALRQAWSRKYIQETPKMLIWIFLASLLIASTIHIIPEIYRIFLWEHNFSYLISRHLQLTFFTVFMGILLISPLRVPLLETYTTDPRDHQYGARPRQAGIFSWINLLWEKHIWPFPIITIIVVMVFLGFALTHLWQFMSVDEPKWLYERVPQLYTALSNGAWEETYINDKPGILPSLLAGTISSFFDFTWFERRPEIFEWYLFIWRLPIVLFSAGMLLLVYLYSNRLFGKMFAVLATALIAFHPILMGISQIVNPDATLWSTSLLAFLTFFLYIKENKFRYVLLTGIFLWLALISKFFASFFYLLFFVVILWEYLLALTKKEQFFTRILDLLKIYGISMLVYTFLFPATWINPEQIFLWTIAWNLVSTGVIYGSVILFIVAIDIFLLDEKIIGTVRRNAWLFCATSILLLTTLLLGIAILLQYNVLFWEPFFTFNDYVFSWAIVRGLTPDLIALINNLFVSFYSTFYVLPPTLLLGFYGSIFVMLRYYKRFSRFEMLMLLTIFVFYFIFIFGGVKSWYTASARYQIILFPVIACLVALVITRILPHKGVLTAIIVASIIPIWSIFPFYFVYTNSLNSQDYVTTELWWFGWYEVAQFLNALQETSGQDIAIWVDREGVNNFYSWTTFWRGRHNPFEHSQIEYLVLTPGGERIFRKALKDWKQWSRYHYAYIAANTSILEYYESATPIYIKHIGHKNNWIKVVPVSSERRYSQAP